MLFCGPAFALPGALSKYSNPVPGKPALFIENVGQIRDQHNALRSDVDYSIALGNATVYVGRGILHYQFSKSAAAGDGMRPRKPSIRSYRMDVTLAAARPGPPPFTSGRADYFEQFYCAGKGLDGAVAHAFSRVVYKDIYPGIDWTLYTDGASLEYDFVVHAGADPRQIRICYSGALQLRKARDGSLAAVTPFGAIEEQAPVAYEEAGGKRVPVQFAMKGNTAGFDLKAVARTTIIDPAVRIWGTYYGGTGEDYGYGLTTDSAGNVYLGGATAGGTNVVTTGAHQTTFGGYSDGMLVKLNAAGVRLWATYYGGIDQDEIRDVALDGAGNVYAAGTTESNSGIATAGAHRATFTKAFLGSGNWDAFLVKFNSSGVRQWGTYYGDTLRDVGMAVVCDAAGNVYLGGETYNGVGISSAGAYQPSFIGDDAFIAKFNPLGQRIWGSYYGGNGIDKIFDLCYDPYSKTVYLAGQTNSTNNIASAGAVQPVTYSNLSSGDYDGFIMGIDTAGTRKWGTYYGSIGTDVTFGVAADGKGAVYTTGGYTPGTHLVTPGAYQTFNSGGNILARFDTGGVRQWATWIYGTNGRGITTGAAGDVFITGGAYINYVAGTRGAFQLTASPGVSGSYQDGYVMKFSPDGQRIWGSYYGTNSNEYGAGISYNKATNSIFFGGTTFTNYGSTTNLGSAGALQATSPGGYADAFVARFANDTNAYIRLPFFDTLLCAGSTIPVAYGADTFRPGNVFTIQLSNTGGGFGAGATIIGTATATTGGVITCSIPATAAASPYYKIRVLATNPVDTSEPIRPDILMGTPISGTTTAGSNSPICTGDTLRLFSSFSGTGTITHYQWSGPNGYFNVAQNPYFYITDTGLSGRYYVRAMNGGCGASGDSVTVLVKPLPDTAIITTSTRVCSGDTLHLYATTTTPGATITWSGPNGFSGSGPHVAIPSVTASAGGWYFAYTKLAGCASYPPKGKPILVLPSNGAPGVSISVSPGQTVPAGSTVTFLASASNAGAAPVYEWRLNGALIPGQTTSGYTTSTLSDGDAVSVLVHSSTPCPRPDTAVSALIVMHVSSTGVESSTSSIGALRLSPSPNDGSFTLQGLLSTSDDASIQILDFSGRRIYQQTVHVRNGILHEVIALDKPAAPGVYVLRVVQRDAQARATFTIR